MAKIIECPLCGKQINTSLFRGNSDYLTVADGGNSITCCEDCYEKYKVLAKAEKTRFSAKYDNLRKQRIKLNNEELGKVYAGYVAEMHAQNEKYGHLNPEYTIGCFGVDHEGRFCAVERAVGFGNEDYNADDMILTVSLHGTSDSCMFDKNDITKIEYKRCSAPVRDSDSGESIASYDIFLNPLAPITYKPCVARVCVYAEGNLFNVGKRLEQKVVEMLVEFRNAIGSDLPITKIK